MRSPGPVCVAREERGQSPAGTPGPADPAPTRDTAGAGAGDTKHTSGEWRVESGHPPSVNSYLSRLYIIRPVITDLSVVSEKKLCFERFMIQFKFL